MKFNIAILGLGYVGLPLALEFGKKFKTLGFDINKKRIQELKKYKDSNLQFSKSEIKKSVKLNFTNNANDLEKNNFYIISIPTPITKKNKPDFSYLKAACKTIGKYISNGDFVVFESTVYPGATREICLPILEKLSKYESTNYC